MIVVWRSNIRYSDNAVIVSIYVERKENGTLKMLVVPVNYVNPRAEKS